MAPKIYHLHPLVAGPLTDWPGHFARCRDLGFDAVCLAPPFAPGDGGDGLDHLHVAIEDVVLIARQSRAKISGAEIAFLQPAGQAVNAARYENIPDLGALEGR